MAVSQGFAEFVVEQLEGCGVISTRRMFGGMGIYCGDTFFALIDNDVLYLKVDDITRKAFEDAGSHAFRPYGDERASMNYYSVPASVLEDSEELTTWGRRALEVAQRAKKGRPPRARQQTPRAKRR